MPTHPSLPIAAPFYKMLSVMLLAFLLVMDGYGYAMAQSYRGGGNMMRQGNSSLNQAMRGGGRQSTFGGGNSRNIIGGGNRSFGGGRGGMRLGGGNGGGRMMDPARMYPKVPNIGTGRSNKQDGPAFAPPRQQGVAIY